MHHLLEHTNQDIKPIGLVHVCFQLEFCRSLQQKFHPCWPLLQKSSDSGTVLKHWKTAIKCHDCNLQEGKNVQCEQLQGLHTFAAQSSCETDLIA